MQADKRGKRENSKKNFKLKKTKAREDEGFEKKTRRKGSRREQVCWQQVWGRDWVKSAENKADDVGEARFDDDSASSSLEPVYIKMDFLIFIFIFILIIY